jgi:hypothetical protein
MISAIESDQVRRIESPAGVLYCLPDILGLLGRGDRPADYWDQLLHRDSGLRHLAQDASFPASNGGEETLPAVPLQGIFRLVQSVQTPRAEPLKRWLAAIAVEELEESADPELAVARARREYERRGYPRQWVDQRMRSVSARAEIVGEWHRRGAHASEDYRTLTNALTQEAFGMDVETYRQHKGLFGRENLRDYMTEPELALLTLGETIAATLHRRRGSQSLQELERDMQDAGRIVADTLQRIQQAGGGEIVQGERPSWAERRNPGDPAGNAESRQSGREILFRRNTPENKPSP